MQKWTRLWLAIAIVFSALFVARAARAEWIYVERESPYARRHAYLSAEVVGVGVLGQTGRNAFLDPGAGARLAVGGRLTRWFALEGVWQPTFHNLIVDAFGTPVDRVQLHALTLDAKFYPVSRLRVQPYFGVGAGAHLMRAGFDPIASGPGWHGDFGFDVWLLRSLSVNARISYRGVELYGPEANDQTYLSLFEGGAGIAARF